jgi:hypothetical protein
LDHYERKRLEREQDVFGGLKGSRYKSSGFCPNCSELLSMGSLTCFACNAVVGERILMHRETPPSGTRTLFEKARFERELEALRKEIREIGDVRTHQEQRKRSASQASDRVRIKQKMDARKKNKEMEARKTSRFWILLRSSKKLFQIVLKVMLGCSLIYALYAWATYLFF